MITIALAGLLAIAPLSACGGRPAPAQASENDASVRVIGDLRGTLDAYLTEQRTAEHVSAASLSVNLPDRGDTIDVSAGSMRFDVNQPVPMGSVWQIGSNTKAFTAALMLKLEADRRLSIDDTVGRWLPHYPQWKDVTLRRLLNMTSGIPSYEEQRAFLADYVADPYANDTTERLVSYAAQAPATSGYSYSNTNYILAQMIIERASGDTYDHQLYNRIINPLGLHELTFSRHVYPVTITAREPAGYFFLKEIPVLLGHDVSRHSLSFAQGAGGIVGTTREMTRWERALYSGRVLPATQQAELLSLVSTKTGQPIGRTSQADPAGYGLGVQQGTTPKFGTFWTYEGGTFGFRTLHLYLPGSGLIMAIGLNSSTSQDHVMTLAGRVYDTLLAHRLIAEK